MSRKRWMLLIALTIALSFGFVYAYQSGESYSQKAQASRDAWKNGSSKPKSSATVAPGAAVEIPQTVQYIDPYWSHCTRRCYHLRLGSYPLILYPSSLARGYGVKDNCVPLLPRYAATDIHIAATIGTDTYNIARSADGKTLQICGKLQDSKIAIVIWTEDTNAPQ